MKPWVFVAFALAVGWGFWRSYSALGSLSRPGEGAWAAPAPRPALPAPARPKLRPSLSLDVGRFEVGERSVTGVFTNTTGGTLRRVRVVIQSLDSEGSRLTDLHDSISLLEPGQVWRFEAPFWGRMERFKLSSVSAD